MRSVFAAADLPLERDTGSGWEAIGPSPNHFRLLEGAPAPDAWNAQIVLGLPPMLRQEVRDERGRVVRTVPIPRRASRGLTVVLAMVSPEAAAEGARPIPERLAMVMPPEPGGDTRKGHAFRWEQVGTAVGRLLVGGLHARAGLLTGSERVSIAPVQRAEAGR
jgi:hypothetical protein